MLKPLAIGFSREAVEELSRQKGEPEWMLQKRLQAWEVYESIPAHLGRRGDLGTYRTVANFKFQQVSPYVPAQTDQKLPPAIESALSGAMINGRSGLIAQYNGTVVRCELSEELKQQGVILSDLETAMREHPE